MGARFIPAFAKSSVTVARNLWRVSRQLFHEVTSAMFGLFAAYGAVAAWRAWRHGRHEWLTALALGYAAVMAAFAAVALRSARRVR